MRVSLEWLREYTDFGDSAEELANRLTMTSLESVAFLKRGEFFPEITVGEVNSVEDHPDADKLRVCLVNTGKNDLVQIICGAPNVASGQKVPIIHPGTELPDGNKIESVKIRGVQSHGMIPSERELGLSDSHAGILVLRDDAAIGSNFWDYLEDYWQGLDIEITPNRPDGMSHIGIAREISTINETSLNIPEINIDEGEESVEDAAKVIIHNAAGCPRYAARVVKNVEIGPSPLWLQQRLRAVGLRPINNVVDASNYVLMETGHPLHTFDYDKLADGTIEVRSASDGEKFTTLDGKERELTDEILLICDAEDPVAIAGIMGGENSEVTEDSTNILIESAYFDPGTIRRGSKYLGLSTEASKRFERGADPEGVLYALNRLTAMIQHLAGGDVAAGVLDEYPKKIAPITVDLRVDRVEQVIGTRIPEEEIRRILTSLEFTITESRDGVLTVKAPTFRPDIEREIDLIEEVLRIYGTENVPSPEGFQIHSQAPEARDDTVRNTLTPLWQGFGFNETYSYSLVNKEYCYPKVTGKSPVRLRNPLSEELAYLRTTLLPVLVEGVKRNVNRKETDVRLFEFGRVFDGNPKQESGVEESEHFAAVASGNTMPESWTREQKKIDFYGFKGYIEATLEVLGLSYISYKHLNTALFKPGFAVMRNGSVIGQGGEFNSALLENFEIDVSVFGVELNLDTMATEIDTDAHYQAPSPYPSVERDLSFVVDDDLNAADLTRVIQESGGPLLHNITLYDVYAGEQIPDEKKSLTYALKFLSVDKTLTEEEVDKLVETILVNAQNEVNAQLRDQ
ncbi:MAG: phenylalanine--tRNA ligase subunit beta [Candidatus Marinimicrobia bacterium]|nr:phenylalanine--tRNA ligase subunit beta [Candidatus Neomarinimicrobiota bacterium]MCF7828273.1 phenylalanine--tRNA ligase subunit beta [Candidatus Neomarinimicrobiota bacterium]MCF7879552.1 phenylalanine--tRNA ligase subunit beta [Candidatus Neomarinimicrobiota bacterium]